MSYHAGVIIIPRACICGHDHFTHRGEFVEMCLECSCMEYILRCQNCGDAAERATHVGFLAACSVRCATQLEYARSLSSGCQS